MNWVAVGVKCVCVDDNWSEFGVDGLVLPVRQPMKNEVLTISGVNKGGEALGLCFEEIRLFQAVENSRGFLCANCWWDVAHFRPLVTLESDVEKFKLLLVPTRRLENV